jgi:hypothetical protein
VALQVVNRKLFYNSKGSFFHQVCLEIIFVISSYLPSTIKTAAHRASRAINYQNFIDVEKALNNLLHGCANSNKLLPEPHMLKHLQLAFTVGVFIWLHSKLHQAKLL